MAENTSSTGKAPFGGIAQIGQHGLDGDHSERSRNRGMLPGR
jgi:hypothetical protein